MRFTRVVDIRCKKLDAKMSSNERKAIKTAQQVYKIGNKQTELTAEEKKEDEEALALFNQLRNKK